MSTGTVVKIPHDLAVVVYANSTRVPRGSWDIEARNTAAAAAQESMSTYHGVSVVEIACDVALIVDAERESIRCSRNINRAACAEKTVNRTIVEVVIADVLPTVVNVARRNRISPEARIVCVSAIIVANECWLAKREDHVS